MEEAPRMDELTETHEPPHQLMRMVSVEMIMGHTYPLSIGSCSMDFKDGLWGGMKHRGFVLEETDVVMIMRFGTASWELERGVAPELTSGGIYSGLRPATCFHHKTLYTTRSTNQQYTVHSSQ